MVITTFAETASLPEVAVGMPGLCKAEHSVYDGPRAMLFKGAVEGLEAATAAYRVLADGYKAAVEQVQRQLSPARRKRAEQGDLPIEPGS